MITLSRLARTKQLAQQLAKSSSRRQIFTYYALGKDRPKEAMTSAMQIVADRETPTRQCTSVAAPSYFPLPRDYVNLVL